MTYRVVYTDGIKADIAEKVTELRDESVSEPTIEKWFSGLFDRIDALYEAPKRHPVAGDLSSDAGFEVRKLTYGQYLVYHRVDDDSRLVAALTLRHGRRMPPELGVDAAEDAL